MVFVYPALSKGVTSAQYKFENELKSLETHAAFQSGVAAGSSRLFPLDSDHESAFALPWNVSFPGPFRKYIACSVGVCEPLETAIPAGAELPFVLVNSLLVTHDSRFPS